MSTLLQNITLLSELSIRKEDTLTQIIDAAFITKVIRRAEWCGYLPAAGQRDVDWTEEGIMRTHRQ